MRRFAFTILLLLSAATGAYAQNDDRIYIPQSPEQQRRAEQLLNQCRNAVLRIDECVIHVYFHTLRNWGVRLSRVGRNIAGALAVIELIVLGYVYIMGRSVRPERLIIKTGWRLLLFAVILWALQSWSIFYTVPAGVIERLSNEMIRAPGTPTGLNPTQLPGVVPDADRMENGVILSSSALVWLGMQFFWETIKDILQLKVLLNPSLLFAPFIGLLVMLALFWPAAIIVTTTVEIYLGLTIGAVMMGLSVFKGTRMISASVLSTLARGIIQLFLLLLMSSLLIAIADMAVYLLGHYNDFLPLFPGMALVQQGGSLIAMAAAGAMVSLGVMLTVIVPSRLTRSISQYINWNFRELLDDD